MSNLILPDDDVSKTTRFWALSHVWGKVSPKPCNFVTWPVPINDVKENWILDEAQFTSVADSWATFLKMKSRPPIWVDLFSADPTVRGPRLDLFQQVYSEAEIVVALLEDEEADWLENALWTSNTENFEKYGREVFEKRFNSQIVNSAGFRTRRFRLWVLQEDYLAREILYVRARTGEPIIIRKKLLEIENAEYYREMCEKIGYVWTEGDPRESHIRMLEIIKVAACSVESDREKFLSNAVNVIATVFKKNSKLRFVSLPVLGNCGSSYSLSSFSSHIDTFGNVNFGGIYLSVPSVKVCVNIGNTPVVCELHSEIDSDSLLINNPVTITSFHLHGLYRLASGLFLLTMSILIELIVLCNSRLPSWLKGISAFSIMTAFDSDLSNENIGNIDWVAYNEKYGNLFKKMFSFLPLTIAFGLYLCFTPLSLTPFAWSYWVSAFLLPISLFSQIDTVAVFFFLLKYPFPNFKFEIHEGVLQTLLYVLFVVELLNIFTPHSSAIIKVTDIMSFGFSRLRIPQFYMCFGRNEGKSLYLVSSAIRLLNDRGRRSSLVMKSRTWLRVLLNNVIFIIRMRKWPVFLGGDIVVPHDAKVSRLCVNDVYNNKTIWCCHYGGSLLYAWHGEEIVGEVVGSGSQSKITKVFGVSSI
ncbi:hypothetical protein HK098_002186 [Nowakowskiella sp. JEL0407]|nr:hypothetical protein HK098_002186 [Nowakowskiella sp. JEL0407]